MRLLQDIDVAPPVNQPDKRLMNIRTRKLIGTIAILALIAVYAIAAMMIGIHVLPEAPKFVEFLYYFIAGLLWIIPAGMLIRWMSRPDNAP